jgi:ATP-binding cassette subfamily C (CFTR/MRP) protein 1
MARPCPLDSYFGPAIGSCRGGFDFTLVFEESILGLLPQALFLLLTPIRLFTLRRRRSKIAKDSHLGFLKLTISTLYVISNIVLLALWARVAIYRTNTSVASAIFELLGSIAVVLLSRLEHTRAMRPSHLLQLFLLIMLICDGVRLRTLFLMMYPTTLVAMASIKILLTGFLLLLESLDKSPLMSPDQQSNLSPEDTIGLFSQKLFLHLNGLFHTGTWIVNNPSTKYLLMQTVGYRKILTPNDLHNIGDELSSNHIRMRFQATWEKHRLTNSRFPIYFTILQVLCKDILLPIPPKLLYMGTTLAQPFLITAMVDFIEDKQNKTQNIGYGLIGAYALNYTLMAICNSWYKQETAKFSTKLRSCLVSCIFTHTLCIHPKNADVGSGTVLMNVDVEKVLLGLPLFHEFWTLLITCGASLYILYAQLGITFIAPTIVSFVMVGICYQMGKWMKPRQVDWVNATEKRVTAISSATSNLKEIRMLGLSCVVHEDLTRLREEEVEKQLYVRKLLSVILAIGKPPLLVFLNPAKIPANNTFQITTLFTYVLFVALALSQGNRFNFQVLFGSLSALKLVTTPLLPVLQWIAIFTNSMASLERIQNYLRGDVMEQPAQGVHGNNARDVASEIELVDSEPSSPTVIRLARASFGVEVGKPLLQDINLAITSGTFTMVVGKVGSGKSLLLRALVGEMWHREGIANLPMNGISFCAQSPWLRNSSIRENILAESPFEENWYHSVTWSCALDQDFDELRKGDATLIGSKGISLSGGQKNRITLARALYARKPVLILDDILSGLDKTTEMMVFQRVFGQTGLLRRSNSTVLLATHSVHWASESDQIVLLADGAILEHGPYSDLKTIKELGLQNKRGSPKDGNLEDQLLQGSPKQHETVQALIDTHNEEERRSGDKKSFAYYMSSIGHRQVSIYMILTMLSVSATTAQCK